MSEGWVAAQLTRAAQAAASPDPGLARRGAARLVQWVQVADGMASGRLRIGSRTPVRGLPAWVTPVVVRGGFATGRAAAGGPLTDDERALARSLGLAASREELFRHHVGEADGLRRLWALLDDRDYALAVPEEGALLTVAWLVRAGDLESAVALARELSPLGSRLRFLPRPRSGPRPVPGLVARQGVEEVARALRSRREQPRLAAQREAVTVWAPFADRLLAHWSATVVDGRVDSVRPEGWVEAGRGLLGEYADLAAAHTLTSRHRDPEENLGILRSSLQARLGSRALTPRQRGLLQHAVDSMVRRRGAVGSEQLAACRRQQRSDVAGPSHRLLAEVVARRLDDLPRSAWLTDVAPVLAPVSAEESAAAAGTPLPPGFGPVVRRARAATVEELMADGTVPSAEVLAELAPALTADVVADACEDPVLRDLVAEVYRAFGARRSLLLRDLEHQVRPDELPWVRAAAAHASEPADGGAGAERALRRVAGLALEAWPGTVLPNALVTELQVLARAAGRELPLTEELAADIFTGRFTPKFAAAAGTAATLLDGSLYARCYRLPRPGAAALDAGGRRTAEGFAALCRERAGVARTGYDVAANGAVIEQAQVLTTHNLAVLVAEAGYRPARGWRPLADGAARRCVQRLDLATRSRRPLRAVKDAAYAWRQAVFFLSMDGAEESPAGFRALGRSRGPTVGRAWSHLLDGLDDPGASSAFYGWTRGPHPLLRS